MGNEAQVVAGGGIAVQGMFFNRYTHSMDAKKRLTIPADWRDAVGSPQSVVVLPSVTQPYLRVYPANTINERLQNLKKLPGSDPKARQYARMLASRSNLLPWDTQGRIRVGDDLLKHAELENEVVLVGAFECFELWSPKRWNEQIQSVTQSNLGEAEEYVGF